MPPNYQIRFAAVILEAGVQKTVIKKKMNKKISTSSVWRFVSHDGKGLQSILY